MKVELYKHVEAIITKYTEGLNLEERLQRDGFTNDEINDIANGGNGEIDEFELALKELIEKHKK